VEHVQRSTAAWLAAAIVILLGLLGPLLASAQAVQSATPRVDIEVFVREGCPHCAAAEEFLAKLKREQPQLAISIRDVNKEPEALQRLTALTREHGGVARVPAFFVGNQLLFGYSEAARSDLLIRNALAGRRSAQPTTAGESTCELADPAADPKDILLKPCKDASHADASAAPPAPEPFQIDFLGRTLTLDDIGLPAFTFAIGLLDGFNPCSMWVLLLMISLLAPLNDRPRMLAIAGTFVLIQGIAYFIFLAAWLNLFLLIGLARWSQLLIAAIAIIAGLINLKDFFAFKWGLSLSIPEHQKPKIYQRMRGILTAKSLTAAIIATIVLAVLVQIVELLCTSGFPALFTRILTMRELDTATYYGYLLLYMAAYMIDDMIVLGIGVTLLSRHRLQEREGRVLKFLSGLAMVGLGIYLIFE
jgi:glutaredoxin